MCDGITKMVPREKMNNSVKKFRDMYKITPGAPFYQKEFGFYCIDRWLEEGKLEVRPEEGEKFKLYLRELFGFDEPVKYGVAPLGWTEAAFVPVFEEKHIEDRGDHEVVRDYAGRHVLYFKGRRHGFMPEYIDHPVKDFATWEKECKWRLDPKTPERLAGFDEKIKELKEQAAKGMFMTQGIIGGYMYLRSLIGPEEVMYMFYDEPELIRDCMETWYNLADSEIARYQEHITIDEIFFAEDICYNSGPLISPAMIEEFLFPYYKKLLDNMKKRQIDKNRHLYIQVDTDGKAETVIDLYKSIGMDVMSPFEVASGSDVLKIGKEHPDLVILGGIDKRVLATDKDTIDRYLDPILSGMHKRGGYMPMCDHGVPSEVSFENYLHFRKRCLEYNK